MLLLAVNVARLSRQNHHPYCVYHHPPATYSILYMDAYFTKADVKVNPATQAKCGHVALYDLLRSVARCDSAQYTVCFLCRII